MLKVASYHLCELGEGPVWDEKLNRICWIDIRKGDIHELDVTDSKMKTTTCDKLVGSIALCEDDSLLVAQEDGLTMLNRNDYTFSQKTSVPKSIDRFRFNDGKCDKQGHFWVGSMSDDEQPNVGSLYSVDGSFSFNEKLTGVTIPNGIAWDEKNGFFYFIDTPTFKVMRYSFDAEHGTITNPTVACSISKEDGYPDGMTIDTEGMLWIAHWDGWKVTQWNPTDGVKLQTIKLPVARVTSCTFGGEHFNDLYITTAKVGLSDTALAKQPLAGALFVVKNCGSQGSPANRFKM